MLLSCRIIYSVGYGFTRAKNTRGNEWFRKIGESCFYSQCSNCQNLAPLFARNKLTKLNNLQHYGLININQRYFRTTPPNHFLPPALLMILSKVGQAGAILLGRRFRNLPPEKRLEYMAKARKHRRYLYGLLAALGVGGIVYYQTHLEEAPITNRKRFLAFNDEQLQLMSDIELKSLLELHKEKLIPSTDARHKRVYSVAQRLVDANKDLLVKYGQNKDWTLSLIEDKMSNAFVLSNGSIFVFTGLLELCDEEGPCDSTLAIFLSHELSHVLLGHAREQASVLHLLDAVLIIPFLLLWSLMPSDATAALFQWLLGRISDLLLTLPYGRTLEGEADYVGLILAAKACFDVRQCIVWKKLEMRDTQEGVPKVDFLSTHPSGDSRYEHLLAKMPEMLAIREDCKCPKLPFMDEQKRFQDYQKRLEKSKKENTSIVLKPLKL